MNRVQQVVEEGGAVNIAQFRATPELLLQLNAPTSFKTLTAIDLVNDCLQICGASLETRREFLGEMVNSYDPEHDSPVNEMGAADIISFETAIRAGVSASHINYGLLRFASDLAENWGTAGASDEAKMRAVLSRQDFMLILIAATCGLEYGVHWGVKVETQVKESLADYNARIIRAVKDEVRRNRDAYLELLGGAVTIAEIRKYAEKVYENAPGYLNRLGFVDNIEVDPNQKVKLGSLFNDLEDLNAVWAFISSLPKEDSGLKLLLTNQLNSLIQGVKKSPSPEVAEIKSRVIQVTEAALEPLLQRLAKSAYLVYSPEMAVSVAAELCYPNDIRKYPMLVELVSQHLRAVIPVQRHDSPSEKVKRTIVKPNPKVLQSRIEELRMRAEGFAPDRYRLREIFQNLNKNPYYRHIPIEAGVATSSRDGQPVNGTVTHHGLEMFYQPTGAEISRLSYLIERCGAKDRPLRVFVPTCPCDPIKLASHENQANGVFIAFPGGPLIEGISWTGVNTLDGIEALVSTLREHPQLSSLKFDFRFGLGDHEVIPGNHRQMGEESFNQMVEKNSASLRAEFKRRMANGIGENVNANVGTLVKMAGGKDRWIELNLYFANALQGYFDSDEFAAELGKLVATRRNIYEFMQGRGTLPESEIRELLCADLADYCVFHYLAVAEWGADVVLAGDAKAMESLASRLVYKFTGKYVPLLLVKGAYSGGN